MKKKTKKITDEDYATAKMGIMKIDEVVASLRMKNNPSRVSQGDEFADNLIATLEKNRKNYENLIYEYEHPKAG